MSRFEKLSYVIWYCQYHIVWVPKYRYRILRGRIKEETRKTLIIQSERLGCEIRELNIQEDHAASAHKGSSKNSDIRINGNVKRKISD